MLLRLLFRAALILVFFLPAVRAQDVPTTVDDQLPLLLKIISFDRNMPDKAKGKIVIGIVYQEKYRTSNNMAKALEGLIAAFKNPVILGYPVEFRFINLSEQVDLNQYTTKHNISVLYVLPLRAFDINRITTLTQSRKILSFTGVPEYVSEGISVGIGIRGDKPKILINLQAAKNEGCDFNSLLLRLSQIID